MAVRNQSSCASALRLHRGLAASVLACASLGIAVCGGEAGAQTSDPADPFQCRPADGGVLLEWSFEFFAPIESWIVSRDGQPIANLPPEDTSYLDEAASAGERRYALHAINFTGDVLALAECRVTVPSPGLRCAATENQVKLEWGPILIDVLIHEFLVTRNGEKVATVPPDQLSHVDTVPEAGAYVYRVFAVTGASSELLVGACRVAVPCFGLETEVSGLEVKLDWSHVPLPEIALPHVFVVSRDGVAIARTEETSYEEAVGAPGRYTYRVEMAFVDNSTRPHPPNILIGSCIVIVPGPIPAPQDLTCRVALIEPSPLPIPGNPLDPAAISPSDPGAIDTDGDGTVDSIFPLASVRLSWSNPVAYDKIVIARNGLVIATLPGDETGFADRVTAGGIFEYEVRGAIDDLLGEAAACTVEIPPPFIPPPQDFTCILVHAVPVDPTNTSAGSADGPVIALPVVILRWWNPIRYESIVILRDGTEIARLPGESMGYRDHAPPPGAHVYGIHGIAPDGRRSRTVECRVGNEPVPPVRDLRCTAVLAVPGDILQPEPVPAAFLRWENGAAYDAILIARNGALIAHLEGSAQSFTDPALPAGTYTYDVSGVLDGRRSEAASCTVSIPGPPARNLLHFARVPSPADPAPSLDDLLPAPAGNRLTCLADNVSPVQGWSFGVASDPRFILPKETSIEGTATAALNGGAGPAFLAIEILEDGTGVTMAAIVDDGSPFETLPPGRGHRLLEILYAAGDEGLPGESYAVRYTSRLGDPAVQVLLVVNGFEVIPLTAPGRVMLPGVRFQRADSNGDGAVDISDPMRTLRWLFLGGEAPGCIEAANANGSSAINIADAIYTFLFLFDGGPPPPHPFPGCDLAPAPLGCLDPGECPPPAGAG
jgi:hypothetical protein